MLMLTSRRVLWLLLIMLLRTALRSTKTYVFLLLLAGIAAIGSLNLASSNGVLTRINSWMVVLHLLLMLLVLLR